MRSRRTRKSTSSSAEDQEVVVEHHPEDWIAFCDLLGTLAFIVFLQFFTRYVLNDSLSWTEEIARYGLMWIVFFGGAMVTRRKTTSRRASLQRDGTGAAARRAARHCGLHQARLHRIARLAVVTIIERMNIQRMTVFDLPMSYVYAGVGFGCFLMLIRQAMNVWRNARDGWRKPDDITHQVSAGLRTRSWS
jgi:TRAP-type C4-dicarboxylate transport system permease small subunit